MTIQQIAKVAHEINRAFCQSIGDKSQPTWEQAPYWQKKSAIDGVRFHIANPDASPSASHDSWLKQKRLMVGSTEKLRMQIKKLTLALCLTVNYRQSKNRKIIYLSKLCIV